MIKVLSIGLGDLKNEVESAKQSIREEVDAELEAASMKYVELAKKDLASQGGDTGTLLKSIGYQKNKKFRYGCLAVQILQHWQ